MRKKSFFYGPYKSFVEFDEFLELTNVFRSGVNILWDNHLLVLASTVTDFFIKKKVRVHVKSSECQCHLTIS